MVATLLPRCSQDLVVFDSENTAKMENKYIAAAFCVLLLFTLSPNSSFGQGMVLNEFSNGDSGTREYMEFVVVGPDTSPNCGPIDLRGWIIDDNNGDFSCGPCSGTGIATGHIRLGLGVAWEAVPTGSIIVVYNDDPGNVNTNMPAADPDDTAPADGVYIVPSSSALIEVSTGSSCAAGNIPFGGTSCPGPCTGNAGYTNACYTPGGSWSNAGMRNGGDAAQVRRPDGTYFHGAGYGSGMNGGPDNLYISGSGSGNMFMFDNSTDNDFRSGSNWSTASVSPTTETPGAPNNTANATWIGDLGVVCLLPVVYSQQLTGLATADGNHLSWATAQEINSDKFIIEKSLNPADGFTYLGEIAASGNSMERRQYEFVDDNPEELTWYRIRQLDLDGQEDISRTVTVSNTLLGGISFQTWPNPADERIQFALQGSDVMSVELVDMTGRIVASYQPEQGNQIYEGSFDISSLESGLYLVRARAQTTVATQRVVKR